MTMIAHKASNENWIKNRTFAYGWVKLNKESCRIFYGQIPRKTMDEKKRETEMVPYFIAPSRVILGHKSYSVGRSSILATPAGNDFPNLSALYHDVGSGFDFFTLRQLTAFLVTFYCTNRRKLGRDAR